MQSRSPRQPAKTEPPGSLPAVGRSLATPNGKSVVSVREERLAYGHERAEYGDWMVKADGDWCNLNTPKSCASWIIEADMDRGKLDPVRVCASSAI